MLGIRSYKDLHYWESLWPNSNPGKHNWYIILLSNLNYQTPAMRLVLITMNICIIGLRISVISFLVF